MASLAYHALCHALTCLRHSEELSAAEFNANDLMGLSLDPDRGPDRVGTFLQNIWTFRRYNNYMFYYDESLANEDWA
jgi:hypothetical protein